MAGCCNALKSRSLELESRVRIPPALATIPFAENDGHSRKAAKRGNQKENEPQARAYDRALHRLDGDSVANADSRAVQRRVNARSQGIVHPRERRAPESARPPSPCLIEEIGRASCRGGAAATLASAAGSST